MSFLIPLIVILLVLILGVLIWIALGVRELIDESRKSNTLLSARLNTMRRGTIGHYYVANFGHRMADPNGAWVIWVWRTGKWQLSSSPTKGVNGPSPRDSGAFEGECRRVWTPMSR